jgi:uncharacterized protein YraI
MRKLLSTIAALVTLTGIAHAESCTVVDPSATPLNVRASPNGKILGALNNGTSVTVTDRRGDWVRVAPLDGKSGWVWREYLRCPAGAEGEKEYLEGIRDYWKGICWHARPYADDDDGAIFWERGFNHALRLDRNRADRSHCRPGARGKTAADVLVVVLADKNGETSIHYQKGVPHEDLRHQLRLKSATAAPRRPGAWPSRQAILMRRRTFLTSNKHG